MTDRMAGMRYGNDERRGGCTASVCAGLMFPVLYVFSAGPAVGLAAHGLLPLWIVELVYFPLTLLARSSPVFADLLEWHLGMWR